MTRVAIALLFALILTLAPSTAEAAKRKNPDVVEDALAFATTDRSKAVTLLESAIEEGPSSKTRSTIVLNAGEQRRLSEDLDAAHAWFTQILQDSDKGMDAEAAKLGLALIQATGGANAQSLSVLRAVSDRDGLDTQNADRHLLLAIDAAQQNAGGVVYFPAVFFIFYGTI